MIECPAKWHLIPSCAFSRKDKYEYDRRTDHAAFASIAIAGAADAFSFSLKFTRCPCIMKQFRLKVHTQWHSQTFTDKEFRTMGNASGEGSL